MAKPQNHGHSVCLLAAFMLAAIYLPAMVSSIPADYVARRRELIQSEQALRTGGNGSTLSHLEQVVNNIMLQEKRQIIEASRCNGTDFAASHTFLNQTVRAIMEKTKSFQIIRKMAKGGVMHIHDESMTSIEWLIQNVTYRDNCYMCVGSTFNVKFHFFNIPPSDPNCVWRLVSAYRTESADPSAFDRALHNNITMVTSDPAEAYPDIDAAWKKFMDYFVKVEGLMLYAPVFRDYLWEGLRQFREDNVQYLEIRALLPKVYELDGTTHGTDWVLNVYKQVIAQFVHKYPDFTGAKIIKSSLRFEKVPQMLLDVKEALRLYQQNRGFVVGFDLVGQEDSNRPLLYYVDDLLYPSRMNPPIYLPYFFLVGETDWQETGSDYNLVDALLLNTTRIRHGYALYKHPLLKEKFKERGTAVEINPISNQVLKLVNDLRNHPATVLIAEDYPLVISSDDPASWEALPLSHDFYMTFMTLTGKEAGLATLKQLAINSLRYSALTPVERNKALTMWQMKWGQFINQVVQDYAVSHNDMPLGGPALGGDTSALISFRCFGLFVFNLFLLLYFSCV